MRRTLTKIYTSRPLNKSIAVFSLFFLSAALKMQARTAVEAASGIQEPEQQSSTLPANNLSQKGVASTSWAKFHGNAQNTGAGGGPGNGKEHPWKHALFMKQVVGSPSLGTDGTVFITAEYLCAVDGATGRRKWEQPAISTNLAGVALDDHNTLYYGGVTGFEPNRKYSVYALNTATGKARWAFPLRRAVTSTPALSKEGILYVQCSDGNLYAIDSVTGKQKWMFALPEPIFSDKDVFKTKVPVVMCSPAIGPDGTVYTSYGRLYAVDGTTGLQKWAFGDEGDKIGNSPAIDAGGTLYVGAIRNNRPMLVAVNGTTGKQIWAFPAQGRILYSPPVVDTNGIVYIGGENGMIYAVNVADGSFKWRFAARGPIVCAPAIGSDHAVYFGSGDHTFYSLEGATGQVRWTTVLSDAVYASPALGANGLLYVPSQDGLLYALRATDGAQGPLAAANP